MTHESPELARKAEDEILLPTYARWPISIVRGQGVHVWDDTDRRYLDMYGGHAVALVGHAHEKVVAALQEAAPQLLFYSTVAYHPARLAAARALVSHAPAALARVFLVNSGTEANEAAFRIARKVTGRTKIVSFEGSFHGRTLDSLSATGLERYTTGVAPLVPDHEILPWNDAEALRRIDDRVAAVILEPVQSMAGVRVAPELWLGALSARAREVGALVIYDEVQTGGGRTGSFFAHGWTKVEPDLITLAKGIASGYPFGAVLATNDAATHLAVGDLGSTFGGGPVACAVALATIRVIEEESLAENAERIGQLLREGLARYAAVGETLGRGLLVGVKLLGPTAKDAAESFRQAGVLVGTSNDPSVLRLLPPLCLKEEDLQPFWDACASIF